MKLSRNLASAAGFKVDGEDRADRKIILPETDADFTELARYVKTGADIKVAFAMLLVITVRESQPGNLNRIRIIVEVDSMSSDSHRNKSGSCSFHINRGSIKSDLKRICKTDRYDLCRKLSAEYPDLFRTVRRTGSRNLEIKTKRKVEIQL